MPTALRPPFDLKMKPPDSLFWDDMLHVLCSLRSELKRGASLSRRYKGQKKGCRQSAHNSASENGSVVSDALHAGVR